MKLRCVYHGRADLLKSKYGESQAKHVDIPELIELADGSFPFIIPFSHSESDDYDYIGVYVWE